MKKILKAGFLLSFLMSCMLFFGVPVQAKENDTVKNGIFAGEINLSGMTAEEASAAVQTYIDSLKGIQIDLLAAVDTKVPVTAGELGIKWANPEIITEALEIGAKGNVIERYKVLKDLEHENLVYPIEVAFDLQAISDILTHRCAKYDTAAVDFDLKKEGDEFQIIEGHEGYSLDVETSIDLVNDYLTGEWERKACSIPLDVAVMEPKGSVEELSQVKDVIGSYSTVYSAIGDGRSINVENGCRLAGGVTLYPGEEYSTYERVAPFSETNGYHPAGSYLNGKVVDSLGGGICQISTTLYNAVLRAELEVTERHNHSMVVSYVDPSADAAIAESAGKDFCFKNNLDYPIYIESYTKNRKVVFNIYGKETRPEGRKVSFESEILEVTNPSADEITADPAQGVGYIHVEGAHIGYKAQLWKVVTQDGVEVSRDRVNKSTYKMSPRSAIVGVSTADPAIYDEVMAAISTSNVDHVKNVVAGIQARMAASNEESEE